MKKNTVELAQEELQKLDQTVRDCSDALLTLSPLSIEATSLRTAIMGANEQIRNELNKIDFRKKM